MVCALIGDQTISQPGSVQRGNEARSRRACPLSIPVLKTEGVLRAVAKGLWELEGGKLASVTKALIVFGLQTRHQEAN